MQGALRAAMSLVSNQASLVKFPNPVVDDLLATAKPASQRLGWQQLSVTDKPSRSLARHGSPWRNFSHGACIVHAGRNVGLLMQCG